MKTSTIPQFLSLATAGIALLLAGCQAPVETTGTPEPGEARLTPYIGVGLNIEGQLDANGRLDPAPFVGQFLPNQDMQITDVRSAVNANGVPRLQFSIENRRDDKQAIQYRFTWFDADGFVQQPDQNPWQTVHLAGKEIVELDSTARSPQARTFRLIIRPLQFKK